MIIWKWLILNVTAQLNSTQAGSDKVIIWTTQPTTHKLLGHFQATQDADFRYGTLFWPN